jgi:hypothetical protein
MTRRREIQCEDPAWLDGPLKAEIDQLLRDIEKEEMQQRKERKQSA